MGNQGHSQLEITECKLDIDSISRLCVPLGRGITLSVLHS